MRFINVEQIDGGYYLDPLAYVDQLPRIRAQLPTGAAGFAGDPAHYDFSSTHCVKDLRVKTMLLTDSSDQISVDLRFEPSRFKHDGGLSIRYLDVKAMSIDVTARPRSADVWPETRRLGDLQLDEILPHEDGCSHEIKFTGGSIMVRCADLIAEWDDVAN